ncbi:uncharacterized protein K489DRAFT_428959 [Dissoconium aciculare CBS 342.82]|uniref:Uncharacterized protein n=1 Tax=Dissoconium aciculare CBS 342.82 TaxID=1314786 RepID=A0A6J3MF34_9PEZI|nr:uncharacterized protein K489DRAFT_428959 [Dissoconium aciculare CBS 342.82]KAF1826616.1 hypothetical protein K489DRAFT_428959 [Dissoconium aciculare CBS 342.82]
MGLHNVLVADENHAKMNAVIDRELCASAPFLAAYDCIDALFRMGAPNGHGPGYPRADELRTAFWSAIPKWQTHQQSDAAKNFIEWFHFARKMKPEYCSRQLPKSEKMEFWGENIRVVEAMLANYGAE